MEKLQLKKEYKRYSEYKDSGIDWIGEIPEDWERRKVKYVGKTMAGGTPSTSEASFWDGDISWLPSGAVQNRIVSKKKAKYITKLALQKSATKLIKPNSVLVALTGATCANIGFLPFESTANQSVVAIHNNENTFSKYLYYSFLANREQFLVYKTGGAQSGINENNVKNIFTAFPDKNEQEKIAEFLDQKTELIDKIIEKKRKLVELLKEKRTAVINQAVTKGLDLNVEMMDSGVVWNDKIPKEWNVLKTKYFCEYQSGDGFPENLQGNMEGEVPFLKVSDINGKQRYINTSFNYVSRETVIKQSWHIIKSNSILTAKIGAALTKNHRKVNKVDVCIDNNILAISPKNNIDVEFLYWLWNIIDLSDFQNISSVPSVNMGQVRVAQYAIPPKEDQKKIVKFLDEKVEKMDKLNNRIEKSINLLTEFKSSLISNVVTGKVKI